eukprot:scaffold570_cov234-Pinguiococcus_pyrenoidosus.AAC.11
MPSAGKSRRNALLDIPRCASCLVFSFFCGAPMPDSPNCAKVTHGRNPPMKDEGRGVRASLLGSASIAPLPPATHTHISPRSSLLLALSTSSRRTWGRVPCVALRKSRLGF